MGDSENMKKVLLRGPSLSQSGYGEHTRFLLRALRKRSDLFDIFLINTNWGGTGWIWEANEEREWIDHLLHKTIQFAQQGGTWDVSLQVTIPNEWEKIAPINIGVTAGIETTKIAPAWVDKSLLMDKIIVVSEHAKYGFDNTEYPVVSKQTGEEITAKVTCPIDVVNYPVKNPGSTDIELELEDDFNFLTVGTWIPRKNLDSTVKWFVEEFHDQKVGLVVKTSLMKNCLKDREHSERKLKELLKEYQDRKCNVYLLHGDMSEQEMTALYQHPKIKAIVGAAHGEGYGLPLFEAAYNELPVICPAWGGQTDFLYMHTKDKKGKVKKTPMFTPVSYDIKHIQEGAVWDGVLEKDSQWCYPKEWDYKRGLRTLYKNHGSAKAKAKKLKKYLLENFSADMQFEKIEKSINSFFPEINVKASTVTPFELANL